MFGGQILQEYDPVDYFENRVGDRVGTNQYMDIYVVVTVIATYTDCVIISYSPVTWVGV